AAITTLRIPRMLATINWGAASRPGLSAGLRLGTWQYFVSHNDATGTCVVSSAKEYRENANECLGWARTAKTDRERDIFLQMARAWLDAAARLERASQPPNAPSAPSRGESPSAGQ